jgi:hypothetical protein
MDLVFDLLQAAGIGAAIGIRPFLPALLVGALAAGDAGVDFDGTDFSFLEKAPFLLALLVGLVALDFARRRIGEDRLEAGTAFTVLGLVSLVIAALEGAGSLADRDHPVVAGILVAAACAAVALAATRPLFARVRGRLEADAAGMLPLFREAAALLAAGLSVLFPPLAILVVGALAWLAAQGRRREGEKYAGLRILR